MIRWLAAALSARWAGALLAFALVSSAAAQDTHIINKDHDNVAIRGYDTVAYFTESRATRGRAEFEYSWQGARWLFAKAEHRDIFARDAERYAPRFGGFCTGGMSLNYIQEPDPENWLIVDGQLYLHHTPRSRERLRENPGAVLSSAEANWRVLGQEYDPAARRPCTTCVSR